MPNYAAPTLTPAAELAINVLGGNAARLAILGFIVEHAGCLVSEIAKGTNLAIGTVKGHISALAATDVLEIVPAPTVPYADRRGRHTRYSVSASKLATHYRELGKLLGIAE